jgi:hypothetical protein
MIAGLICVPAAVSREEAHPAHREGEADELPGFVAGEGPAGAVGRIQLADLGHAACSREPLRSRRRSRVARRPAAVRRSAGRPGRTSPRSAG